jgi:hypothetical protein
MMKIVIKDASGLKKTLHVLQIQDAIRKNCIEIVIKQM